MKLGSSIPSLLLFCICLSTHPRTAGAEWRPEDAPGDVSSSGRTEAAKVANDAKRGVQVGEVEFSISAALANGIVGGEHRYSYDAAHYTHPLGPPHPVVVYPQKPRADSELFPVCSEGIGCAASEKQRHQRGAILDIWQFNQSLRLDALAPTSFGLFPSQIGYLLGSHSMTVRGACQRLNDEVEELRFMGASVTIAAGSWDFARWGPQVACSPANLKQGSSPSSTCQDLSLPPGVGIRLEFQRSSSPRTVAAVTVREGVASTLRAISAAISSGLPLQTTENDGRHLEYNVRCSDSQMNVHLAHPPVSGAQTPLCRQTIRDIIRLSSPLPNEVFSGKKDCDHGVHLDDHLFSAAIFHAVRADIIRAGDLLLLRSTLVAARSMSVANFTTPGPDTINLGNRWLCSSSTRCQWRSVDVNSPFAMSPEIPQVAVTRRLLQSTFDLAKVGILVHVNSLRNEAVVLQGEEPISLCEMVPSTLTWRWLEGAQNSDYSLKDDNGIVRFSSNITGPCSFKIEFLLACTRLLHADTFPPDAHRGFVLQGGHIRVTTRTHTWTIWTEPSLLEPHAPDFSMPYNVATLVSTCAALLVGTFVNVLSRKRKNEPMKGTSS